MKTIIQEINDDANNLFIKREDLLPFSFGGNKARKNLYFFEEILSKKYNYVVTYGSSSSNHCRIVANLAAKFNIPCIIISPEENKIETSNSLMMSLFNAEIIYTPVTMVKKMIDNIIQELQEKKYRPYFIPGGGHGKNGTKAYLDVYEEIMIFEEERKIQFDYIFLASGTGGTQAGLVIGNIVHNKNKEIIGISVGRKLHKGKQAIIDSVVEYLGKSSNIENIKKHVNFTDKYLLDGYGKSNRKINNTIKNVLIQEGIPLDSTYTGKAFWGMKEYIKEYNINNKNILFLHTGGSPLFFDGLKENNYE